MGTKVINKCVAPDSGAFFYAGKATDGEAVVVIGGIEGVEASTGNV